MSRRTATCYSCRRSFPKEDLVRTRVPRGQGGRRHAADLLMCRECSAQQESTNRTVAIIVGVLLVLFILVLLALGIPLDKPLVHR